MLNKPGTLHKRKRLIMSMSMGMGIGISVRQSIRQSISIQMPMTQWSLVQAYQSGFSGPPPYEPPNFEEEEFTPRIKLARTRIPGFEKMTHVQRMRAVDEANAIFHFVYNRGRNRENREHGYYKIPLLRNHNVDPDDIKIRISKAEYIAATATLAAVGEMERIARAVPYYELYKTVIKHLKRMGAKLSDTVIVSVDRGGRIPCIILQRALNMPSMLSLKVDQGSRGDGLDEDRLAEFAVSDVLRGKHILFVDSTVDSGRQINALNKFFDVDPWRERLGYTDWSIVGSNDSEENQADNHRDINWGVDPDSTFEDKPELMGIDYAPGSYTKVVECPSESSKAILECLMSVPDGYIYTGEDIAKEIEHQYNEWAKRQKQRRNEHKKVVKQSKIAHAKKVQEWRDDRDQAQTQNRIERQLERILASKRWQNLASKYLQLPAFTPPVMDADDTPPAMHGNVLIIGNGGQTMPDATAVFVAESLAPSRSLLAGTSTGNPGAVLRAALDSKKTPNPEVRLYQPDYSRASDDDQFGGAPIIFAGETKQEMRNRMITDADAVLVLGGAAGTLHETLIALQMNKPVFLIRGYGAVAEYLLTSKSLRKKPSVNACPDLPDAIRRVLQSVAA